MWVDFDQKCVKICTFSIQHWLVQVLLLMLVNLFLNGTSYNYFSKLKLFSNRGMYLKPWISRDTDLFHWQPTPHQYYHGFWVNLFQSPWSKTHGDIISSKLMVQAYSTSSHFQLMIQAHESHWGNFGNCGMEGQELCSIKFQRFKVDKRNMLLDMSSPIPQTLTS